MNDYELIYLIQTENDQYAMELLLKKYEGLIWKYISCYNVSLSERYDFLSEGYLMLGKAVETFDEKFEKTFTRYFELLLKHRFWRLINKTPKYTLCDEIDIFTNGKMLSQERFCESLDLEDKLNEGLKELTKTEHIVYEMFFVKNIKIQEISVSLKKDEKAIYNAIFRIKNKLKKFL